MKKKGFTLVELLVVIAIIAMLLAILMPALNKVRQIAYRVVCSSNLSGLGKACLTYANDNQDSYPLFGSGNFTWSNASPTYAWDNDGTNTGTSVPGDATKYPSGTATVTQSLYLLIKYADVSTGQFVCKATSAKKFDLSSANPVNKNPTTVKDTVACWDFGPVGTTKPWQFCSYSYQMPYKVAANATVGPFPISTSAQAGQAVMADANPWCKDDGTLETTSVATPDTATTGPYLLVSADFTTPTTAPSLTNKTHGRLANSKSHQNDGQNVLYADSHASFETTPLVGIESDNIYTTWGAAAATATSLNKVTGGIPAIGSTTLGVSQDAADSFLVD